MADDVIEHAEVVANFGDVELAHFDVFECQRVDDLPRAAIWRPDRSMPRKELPGKETAIGMRFPPSVQPSSRTRQLSAGAAPTPSSLATVTKRSGWV